MSPLIRAIFPIIAFLVIGYIARLTKKFDPKNSGILINWVLNISIPCMIIIDMTSQDMLGEYRKYIEFFGGYLLTSFILFCLALPCLALPCLALPMPTGDLLSGRTC